MDPLDDVSAMVRSYAGYVTVGLDDDDTSDTDALLALLVRDAIEDRRTELSDEQRRRVEHLDGVLATNHGRVADVLPIPTARDRRRWWWFLHEGPQVRDDALAATRGS